MIISSSPLMIYIHKSQIIKLHQTALPIIKFQYPLPPKAKMKNQEKVLYEKLQPEKILTIEQKGLEKSSKVQGEQKTGKNNYNHSSTSNTFIKPPPLLFRQQNEVSPRTFLLPKTFP